MDNLFAEKKGIVIIHNSFGLEDAIEFMKKKHITLTFFEHNDAATVRNSDFEEKFYKLTSSMDFDFVFSFNYYPVVSHCCNKLCNEGYNIKYISLIYDNPHILLYTYTISYPCNRIFTFDYSQYAELYNGGIKNIFYTPLPVYSDRYNKQLGNLVPSTTIDYKHEICFIGSMYNEEHNLYERLYNKLKVSSPYVCGYLDSLVEIQSHIHGAYILEDSISDSIFDAMYKAYPYEPGKYSIATSKYGYANYFLGRKVAEIERKRLLGKLSERFDVTLYTKNPTPELPKVHNMGPVDYYNDMPVLFRKSKINLNISLKTIKTGIPLRCMDILGCGGFLLTNYQEDFLRHFTPDEDYVYFSSDDDLMEKTEYYLSHDKEREEIAYNGYINIQNNYTYENIFTQLLEITLFEN